MSEVQSAPVTWDELRVLTLQWLDTFEMAAHAQDQEAIKRLFSKIAVIFGCDKGGCLDWPLQLQFKFDIANAKIARIGPRMTVTLVDWSMQPLVMGGEVKTGRSTVICQLIPTGKGNKAEFVCLHAHFSTMP